MKRFVALLLYIFLILIASSLSAQSWKSGKIVFWTLECDIAKPCTSFVYTMNADGSDLKKIAGEAEPGRYTLFSLSPDCKKVAFSKYANPGKFDTIDVAILELDSGRLTNLTNGKLGACMNPRWSPDGEKIVVQSGQNFGHFIYIMNSDGTNVEEIGEGTAPDFSPDGQRISFKMHEDTGHLYIMDMNGSNRKRIVDVTGSVADYRWSPDGDKIVFSSHMNNENTIYVTDLDGNADVILREADVVGVLRRLWSGCAWSPDGQKIAILGQSEADELDSIWVMDPDGSNLEKLTNNDIRESLFDWRDPRYFGIFPSSSYKISTWGNVKKRD